MIRVVNGIIVSIGVLLTAIQATDAATPEPIVPYSREITLLGDCGANAWVARIVTVGADRGIEVRLEPDFDIASGVVTWDLILRERGHGRRNLLEPAGQWHGAQPFSLAAGDFLRGPANSVFGAARTLPIPAVNLVVRIEVKDAKVSGKDAAGFYVFSAARIVISVDNLR
jgi:hypothetical protein